MSFPHCDVRDLEGLLWTHVALLSLCAILVLASFNAQFKDAAPYGRHADPQKAKAWGFPIPQRVGHTVSSLRKVLDLVHSCLPAPPHTTNRTHLYVISGCGDHMRVMQGSPSRGRGVLRAMRCPRSHAFRSPAQARASSLAKRAFATHRRRGGNGTVRYESKMNA